MCGIYFGKRSEMLSDLCRFFSGMPSDNLAVVERPELAGAGAKGEEKQAEINLEDPTWQMGNKAKAQNAPLITSTDYLKRVGKNRD